MIDLKKNSKLILRLAVSFGLILILIIKTDFTQAIEYLFASNLMWVGVALIGVAGNIIVSAWRLRYILRIYNLEKSISYLAKLYLLGNFYNNFLPTQMGGDVYKAYKLSKDLGKSGEGTFTIFMDRFSGLVILYLIGLVGLYLTFGSTGLILAFIGLVVALGGYYLGLHFFQNKIKIVKKFKKANDIFMKNKKQAVSVFITAIAVQFFALLTTAAVLYAVGADVPMWSIFLYTPVITIMGLFPSINGVGIQDTGYIFFFGSAGVTEEVAFAASILMHLTRFGTSLLGGLLLLTPPNKL